MQTVKLAVVIFGVLALASARPQLGLNGSLRPGARIVGGDPTTIEQFPYIVSLQLSRDHICAGSIVSADTILTTAYCVENAIALTYDVVVGTSRYAEGGEVYGILEILISPNYDGFDHDIAILRTDRNIVFSNQVQPVPITDVAPTDTTPVTVTGWGTELDSGTAPLSDVLREVTVEVVNRGVCQGDYAVVPGAFVSENMMCAGVDEGGKDACNGDVGGPLTQNGVLVGIVSWGSGCAQPRLPGVYTDLSASSVKTFLEENGVIP